MNQRIRNTFAVGTGLMTTLSLASPVFAVVPAQSVNPCTQMAAPWNRLCNVSADNLGVMIGNLILILFIAAALIALIFLIWGGIKWILSGGDKGKVEIARSTIIAALIGLVVTFLSFFILQLVLGIFGIDITNLQIPQLF